MLLLLLSMLLSMLCLQLLLRGAGLEVGREKRGVGLRARRAGRKGGGAADVLADRRAMALLLREAAKTKEKLSANT